MKTILSLFLASLAFSAQAGSLSVVFPDTCTASATGSPATALTITCSGSVTPPVVPPTPTPPNLGLCAGYSIVQTDIDWVLDNSKSFYNRNFVRGQISVFKFRTGNAQEAKGNFAYAEYAGSTPMRTVVVSETPCDFNLELAAAESRPAAVGKSGSGVFVIGTVKQRGYAILKPNTTYYVNMKNASYDFPNNDTCQLGENCGYVFSMSH